MGAVASVRMLVAGTTWRLTGLPAAGGALLSAVRSGAGSERTIAAMQLVKAGERSVPVVTEAVLDGSGPADLVDVLASIGTAASRAALERVAGAPEVGPETRDAAAGALRTLDEL